jgi:hypothetical protein
VTRLSNKDASGRSQFRLAGVSQPFDPRNTAIRPDLADIAVAGQHFAPHYAAPIRRLAIRAVPLRAASDAAAEVVGTLAAGEAFALLDVTGGVAWGYRVADHLVGYCPAEALGAAAD